MAKPKVRIKSENVKSEPAANSPKLRVKLEAPKAAKSPKLRVKLKAPKAAKGKPPATSKPRTPATSNKGLKTATSNSKSVTSTESHLKGLGDFMEGFGKKASKRAILGRGAGAFGALATVASGLNKSAQKTKATYGKSPRYMGKLRMTKKEREAAKARTSKASAKPKESTKPKPKKTYKPASKPVKQVKTKGGTYNVYKKSSSEAKSFRQAFAAARKSGAKVFTWQGRKYSTKTK